MCEDEGNAVLCKFACKISAAQALASFPMPCRAHEDRLQYTRRVDIFAQFVLFLIINDLLLLHGNYSPQYVAYSISFDKK
jgi:hypothetical protein